MRIGLMFCLMMWSICLTQHPQMVSPIFADESTPDGLAKADARKAAELGKEELSRWKFSVGNDPKRGLKFVSTPILRWSNPTAGRVYGNLYVLTDDNRPQVMVCPFKFFTPNTRHDMECVSLASEAVEGIRDELIMWSTKKVGVNWKPVPGDRVVGKTAAERLRQMKQLAGEFVAELLDRRVNEQGEEQLLRLLTQPVHTYESQSHHVQTGGIFAFALGTDPELMLVLEAVESLGTSSWHYGIVRMNPDRLAVRFQNKEVWRVEHIPFEVFADPKQPYFIYNVSEE